MNFYEWAKIRMVHTDSSSAREHNSVNNFSCTTSKDKKRKRKYPYILYCNVYSDNKNAF